MPTFDAGSIQATLELDGTQFHEGIRDARADVERFERERPKVKLGLDASEVRTGLAQLRTQINALRGTNVNIGVSGNTAQIQAMRQQMASLSDTSLSIRMSGGAAVTSELSRITGFVNALDGRVITIRADVDTGAARAQLAALRAQLALLDGQTTTTNVRLGALGGAAAGAGATLGSLRGAITPLVAAALIPLGAAALSAGAALTTMAVAGGGAVGIFGIATMGAIKNVTDLNKSLEKAKANLDTQRAALDRLKPGTDAYALQLKKVEEAQKEVNAAQEAFTPAQRRFNTALSGMKSAWADFIKATEPKTLGVAKTAIEGITDALPKLRPVVNALAPEMQELAGTFKGWVNDGGLKRMVDFLVTTGVPVFHNLRLAGANVATVLGNLFRAFAPDARGMSDAIRRMTGDLAQWSNEGGFQRFLKYVRANAPQVKEFFRALGAAAKQLFAALEGLGPLGLGLTTTFLKIIAATPVPVLQGLIIAFTVLKTVMAVTTAVTAAWAAGQAIATGATRAWAIAQRVLNLAIWSSPITWIVAGIVAVGAAIYLIATKTTWFQTAWKFAWDGIKTAALWVWNNALKPAFNGIKIGLKAVGDAAMWLWKNAIKPAFSFIWTGARLLVVILGTILFTPLYLAFKLLRLGVMALWTFAFKPAFNGIAAAGKWLWANALRPAFNFIVGGLKMVGRWGKWLWDNALKPAWNGIKLGAKLLWAGVKIVFNHFVNGLKTIGRWGKWLWSNALKPAFNWIADGAKWLWNKGIKPPVGWITDGFKTVGKWAKWLWDKGISPFWDKIKDGTTALKNAMVKTWDKMVDGISKTWKAIKKIAAVPINFVIREVYNGGVVKVWNKIADAVGLKKMRLGTAKEIKYAQGGQITGGMAGLDSVSVRAMPGEHIWTAEEVRNAGGHGAMAAMRAAFSSTGRARLAPGQGNVSMAGTTAPGADFTKGSGIGTRYDLGGAIGGAIDWLGDKTQGIGSALAGGAKSIGGWVKKGWDFLADATRGALGQVAFPILKGIKAGVKTGINAVIPGSPPWQDLAAGTATTPIDMLMDWISKDDATYGAGGANVAKALAWAKSQEGKPYIWGGVGPKGYDCSGFMSAIQNVIDGKSPYNRRWATGAFPPGPKGWKRNLKAPFTVGITNAGVGHTAGTLAGTNVESRGGRGVIVGKGARGTKSGLFSSEWGYKPSIGTGGGAGRWSETVSAVLRELGVYSSSNLSNVLKAIQKESGGNPNAVNNWDINARNGNPSKGLLQVIRTTFNAYAGKYKSKGQLDPYANIYAAVRYARSRYGSGWAARMARPGGYQRGGIMAPGLSIVGEAGPELVASSGGDRVFNAQDTQRMLNAAAGRGGGLMRGTLELTGPVTLTVEGQQFPAYIDGRAEATMASVIEETVGSR
ncbi:SLT domain-containing protein [Streptomyces sp. WMMB 714]|uniref:transglycosylase SLT domain-containing protein n=1 Tax=Streptomyces sp. WMMB 714 TaxID=1286822 RepID=UPI000695E205|nr:transglycosylase SLT domain-containing protein [Streptomyces sp. WMMB 714]SCK37166.1 SLT domain-containing protein [Streptomyces sp. WMMB 714]